MSPTDFARMDCSIARALDVVGERWSLLILRDALYGVRRFEDFQHDLGIARNILADRLDKLVSSGLLERHLYQERPARREYRLTRKGRELLPVLLAMMRWGDSWASGPSSPVTLTHTACGGETHAVMACAGCGEELRLTELSVAPIPIKRRSQ